MVAATISSDAQWMREDDSVVMEDNKEMGRDMEIIFIFLPISLERDTFLLLDFWKKE